VSWQTFFGVLGAISLLSTVWLFAGVSVAFTFDGRAAGVRMALATAGCGALTATFIGLAVGA
jgi:hypothetical protein